jgi:nicotinic acid mononucleotide adenylyltransferase
MKRFSKFTESIIDIPRRTYAPSVFDDADTKNPKIKPSVIKMIEDQLAEFEKEYPVLKYTLIGSILTKRWRFDADLDINVLFDVPEDKQEDERVRLSKKYLSASNPDNIQGIEIAGTEHPVNYYFITDEETYDSQNSKADAVFDIKGQKFIKRPEDYVFDMDLYLKDFQKKVDEIDVVKGELKRDIVDYDELSDLNPGDIKNLEKRLAGKLDEIKKNLQDLGDVYATVDAERRDAFDKDMTPDEIRTFSIKNRLPKNVIYKMLEKYHYLTFLKKCIKILDDGEVTDAEIDSLRKEEHGLRPVEEALDKTSKLVFAFGRFNPPTIGHAKLMKEVIIQARKNGANHIVYASASTDKRSNPLDQKTKVKFMKKMFRENKIKKAGGTQRTFMEVLKFYNKIYGEIIMVAGSDRIREFQTLADKYNGTDEYEYKSVKVVSSGERDPDAEGVAGMSASKMREMAKNNDFRSFKAGVTSLSERDKKKLFNAVKKGMGITEGVESFTNFLNNDLREEYHQEKIFNVGDMIEHNDGSSGMIVRRGTNYVSYESDGLIKKAWLYDLKPIEEMTAMRLVDLLPKAVKRKIYRVAHADKYKGALAMYHAFTKDPDMKARGVTKAKMKDIAADHFKLNRREFLRVLDRKTRYEETSMLESLEKEMGDTDEFFELNQVGVKTIEDSYEIGTDEYRTHCQDMTPGQPILSFKLANKVIERNDIDLFADEEEIIDKYKKRYGDSWKDELEKAIQRMKKEL